MKFRIGTEKPTLLEYTAKELQAEVTPEIKHRSKTQGMRVAYRGVTPEGMVKYTCTSGTTAGVIWHQTIRFLDLEEALQLRKERTDFTDRDIVDLLQSGNIALYCNDPSFLYQGWKYMAWNLDYGLEPENRPPHIRNPQMRGSLCKHLVLVLQSLPFLINRIVKDLRTAKVFDTPVKDKKRREPPQEEPEVPIDEPEDIEVGEENAIDS